MPYDLTKYWRMEWDDSCPHSLPDEYLQMQYGAQPPRPFPKKREPSTYDRIHTTNLTGCLLKGAINMHYGRSITQPNQALFQGSVVHAISLRRGTWLHYALVDTFDLDPGDVNFEIPFEIESDKGDVTIIGRADVCLQFPNHRVIIDLKTTRAEYGRFKDGVKTHHVVQLKTYMAGLDAIQGRILAMHLPTVKHKDHTPSLIKCILSDPITDVTEFEEKKYTSADIIFERARIAQKLSTNPFDSSYFESAEFSDFNFPREPWECEYCDHVLTCTSKIALLKQTLTKMKRTSKE